MNLDGNFLRNFLKNAQTSLKSYIRSVITATGESERSILNTVLRTRAEHDLLSFEKDFRISVSDLLSYALSLYDVINAISHCEEKNFSPNAIEALEMYVKKLEKFLTDSDSVKTLFFQYLNALRGEYLSFFRESRFYSINKELLDKAILQVDKVLSLGNADKRYSLNVTLDLIELFQTEMFNKYVRPFTHTEHIWAYLLFSDEATTSNDVIKKIYSCMVRDKVIIGTKMDMCDRCEALVCDVADELGKEFLVVSMSEHFPSMSFSRSASSRSIKKIPIDSEFSTQQSRGRVRKCMNDLLCCCCKDVQITPNLEDTMITLQAIFSDRMLALLGLEEDIFSSKMLRIANGFVEKPVVDSVPTMFKSSDLIMSFIELHCRFFSSVFVYKNVGKMVEHFAGIKRDFQGNKVVLKACRQYLELCAVYNLLNLRMKIVFMHWRSMVKKK